MKYDNHPFSEQEVFIEGVFLEGVQSALSNFVLPDEDVMALGYVNPVAGAPDEALQGEVTVNRFIVSDVDPLVDYFVGDFEGHFNYDEENVFVFKKGHMTDYSCYCTINEVPELNASFKIFGNMEGVAKTAAIVEDNPVTNIYLPAAGDLKLQITDIAGGTTIDVDTNAVQSFDYRIQMDWQPLYTVGAVEPQGYLLNGGALIETIVEIELNDSIPPNFQALVCSPVLKDLVLEAKACGSQCEKGDEKVVRRFSSPCSKLIEYNQLGGVGEVLTAEIVFKSNSTSLAGLKALVTL